jgi:hypothetical protein
MGILPTTKNERWRGLGGWGIFLIPKSPLFSGQFNMPLGGATAGENRLFSGQNF